MTMPKAPLDEVSPAKSDVSSNTGDMGIQPYVLRDIEIRIRFLGEYDL
jgi:hypothetical protein